MSPPAHRTPAFSASKETVTRPPRFQETRAPEQGGARLAVPGDDTLPPGDRPAVVRPVVPAFAPPPSTPSVAVATFDPLPPAAEADEAAMTRTPPAGPSRGPGPLVESTVDELAGRVADAVAALRRESEHLAELARGDAIELGFQVARRILEAEVQARPDALSALVRGAIRRLSSAREVTVRLAPQDAALAKGDRGRAIFSGLQVVKVRVASDPTLTRGDCVVESDVGTVDGRLQSRLREVRDAVDAELAEGDAA